MTAIKQRAELLLADQQRVLGTLLDLLRGGGATVPPGMVPVGVLASVKDAGPAG